VLPRLPGPSVASLRSLPTTTARHFSIFRGCVSSLSSPPPTSKDILDASNSIAWLGCSGGSCVGMEGTGGPTLFKLTRTEVFVVCRTVFRNVLLLTTFLNLPRLVFFPRLFLDCSSGTSTWLSCLWKLVPIQRRWIAIRSAVDLYVSPFESERARGGLHHFFFPLRGFFGVFCCTEVPEKHELAASDF
jgi:hypothetical protein